MNGNVIETARILGISRPTCTKSQGRHPWGLLPTTHNISAEDKSWLWAPHFWRGEEDSLPVPETDCIPEAQIPPCLLGRYHTGYPVAQSGETAHEEDQGRLRETPLWLWVFTIPSRNSSSIPSAFSISMRCLPCLWPHDDTASSLLWMAPDQNRNTKQVYCIFVYLKCKLCLSIYFPRVTLASYPQCAKPDLNWAGQRIRVFKRECQETHWLE